MTEFQTPEEQKFWEEIVIRAANRYTHSMGNTNAWDIAEMADRLVMFRRERLIGNDESTDRST